MEMAKDYNFDRYSTKRVSFVMQTKNHAQFLERAFAGIRKFKGSEDELIVVDGASSDNTRDIIEKNSGMVDVFISEPDLSGNHAQNKGMLLARGRYIKYLGDDDVFHADAMASAIQVMDEHPEIDILLCGGTKEKNGVIKLSWVPPGVNYGKSTEDVVRYGGASGTGQIIRRAVLARLGTLAPVNHWNADVAFVLEAVRKGACVRFCRINLFHHPIFGHSIIQKYHLEHVADTRGLVREYCGHAFYMKYRIRDSVLARMASYWFLKFRAGTGRGLINEESLWDGGFS